MPQPRTPPPYHGPAVPPRCTGVLSGGLPEERRAPAAARGVAVPGGPGSLGRSSAGGERGTDSTMPSTPIPKFSNHRHSAAASSLCQAKQLPHSPPRAPLPQKAFKQILPWVSRENEPAPGPAVCPAPAPCLPRAPAEDGGALHPFPASSASLLCLPTVTMTTKSSHPIG